MHFPPTHYFGVGSKIELHSIEFNLLIIISTVFIPRRFSIAVMSSLSFVANITADIIQGSKATSVPEITTNSIVTINY